VSDAPKINAALVEGPVFVYKDHDCIGTFDARMPGDPFARAGQYSYEVKDSEVIVYHRNDRNQLDEVARFAEGEWDGVTSSGGCYGPGHIDCIQCGPAHQTAPA
jgi:hypothetical protein